MLESVCPFASGRVTHWPSSPWTSTKTKSHAGSVSCEMKNDRSVPESTANVFIRRWYRMSARCEYM